MNDCDSSSCCSDDSGVGFAFVDFGGVDFGTTDDADDADNTENNDDQKLKDDTKVMASNDDDDDNNNNNNNSNTKEEGKVTTTDNLLLDGCKSLSLNPSNSNKFSSQNSKNNTNTTNIANTTNTNNLVVFDKVLTQPSVLSEEDKIALEIESSVLWNDCTISSSMEHLMTKQPDENSNTDNDTNSVLCRIQSMSKQLCNGDYIGVLSSSTIQKLFETGLDVDDVTSDEYESAPLPLPLPQRIRDIVVKYCTTTAKSVEVQMIAVAALNLFLQVNYTGPSLHHGGVIRPGKEDEDHVKEIDKINPHGIFSVQLNVSSCSSSEKGEEKAISTTNDDGNGNGNSDGDEMKDDGNKESNGEKKSELEEPPVDAPFQNSVLAELSVDGEWPCPVCKYPYFLLLARSILLTLADPNRPDWTHSIPHNHSKVLSELASTSASVPNGKDKIIIRKDSPSSKIHYTSPPKNFVANNLHLSTAQLWSGRAGVAHIRLLQADEPSSLNLWSEVKSMFETCTLKYCNVDKCKSESERQRASKILLEYGLAEHHFDVNKKGKLFFQESMQFADLNVEVTGAEGRRTKYQEKSTAQMLVRAKPTTKPTNTSTTATADNTINKSTDDRDDENIKKQLVDHVDETILLDKVKYVDEEDNTHFELSILQQTVLLALCLDVKNKNPMDGLTAEEMGAFLERVLQQHDDWMVYATGLLERAWLECERNHTRERAILQIQALVDQHSNRLTLTQSTFQAAVEDSAPPQDRLKYIHYIVYPPRWASLRDLAERYAKMGIVTSAAEMYEEIELWDEVVECYRRADKKNKAEQVVRKRLLEVETPRMWAALGDITNDPSYYERALEVSKGKYSGAYTALGKYYSDKGDFVKAVGFLKESVNIKPLSPQVWFTLGALSMRVEDWSTALQAFTEVVQQEPEEGDAWANVAAIHMNNKNPSEAYPALNESLKLNRNNWRVWMSKLYTCMDLKKYDEAVQACQVLIDFKSKRNESEGIPHLEEKVIRGIVGGVIETYEEAKNANDTPALDSARRSLSRVRDLLTQLSTTMKSEPWLYEAFAFFHARVGSDDLAAENLMKEYRALQSIRGWETDKVACPKLCRLIVQMSFLKLKETDKGELKKFKFLVNGVVKKIKAAYFDETRLPMAELNSLDTLLQKIENKLSQL